MKRFSALFIAIVMLLCVAAPVFALALDARAAASDTTTPTPAAEQTSGNKDVNITVVVPQPEPTPVTDIPDPLPTPTPKPNPNPAYPELYPSDVYEFYDATSRQIIKTYELTDRENPAGISRDSFERDGWLYELTDITKKENAHASTREHTETVTLETSSRDMDAILAQLAATIEYKSEDGYIGILSLDVKSIAVEQSGTKKSSYTLTETREYPHLSSNDTSLVPKTINKSGVTYNLDSVTWQTQGGAAIDYDYIPTSYTAVAKYTTTSSKTVVTGYTTTAEYKGTISKILTGRTVYTAYFIGQMIVPSASEPTIPAVPEQTVPVTTPEPSTPLVDEPTTPPTAEPTPAPVPKDETPMNPWQIAVYVILIAAGGGGAYYYYRKNKKIKEFSNDEETV